MPRFNPQSGILTDIFNLMPGLVLEDLGYPAIVREVSRDMDTETITFTVNTPDGDRTVMRSWARGDMVRLIGLAVDCNPDNIDLFNS